MGNHSEHERYKTFAEAHSWRFEAKSDEDFCGGGFQWQKAYWNFWKGYNLHSLIQNWSTGVGETLKLFGRASLHASQFGMACVENRDHELIRRLGTKFVEMTEATCVAQIKCFASA